MGSSRKIINGIRQRQNKSRKSDLTKHRQERREEKIKEMESDDQEEGNLSVTEYLEQKQKSAVERLEQGAMVTYDWPGGSKQVEIVRWKPEQGEVYFESDELRWEWSFGGPVEKGASVTKHLKAPGELEGGEVVFDDGQVKTSTKEELVVLSPSKGEFSLMGSSHMDEKDESKQRNEQDIAGVAGIDVKSFGNALRRFDTRLRVDDSFRTVGQGVQFRDAFFSPDDITGGAAGISEVREEEGLEFDFRLKNEDTGQKFLIRGVIVEKKGGEEVRVVAKLQAELNRGRRELIGVVDELMKPDIDLIVSTMANRISKSLLLESKSKQRNERHFDLSDLERQIERQGFKVTSSGGDSMDDMFVKFRANGGEWAISSGTPAMTQGIQLSLHAPEGGVVASQEVFQGDVLGDVVRELLKGHLESKSTNEQSLRNVGAIDPILDRMSDSIDELKDLPDNLTERHSREFWANLMTITTGLEELLFETDSRELSSQAGDLASSIRELRDQS